MSTIDDILHRSANADIVWGIDRHDGARHSVQFVAEHVAGRPDERCETVDMIFGRDLSAPATVASAQWIENACRGVWGTVGALVPNQYPMVLHVSAPEPVPGDWWSAYRALFEVVASTGARHTGTPDRAWFAMWEGHGFTNATTHGEGRDKERVQLREEDEGRNAAIREALGRLPQFHLPNRTYYLLGGAVFAVTQLRYPDSSTEWRNPDLFWPDDRRWFVATDVDLWSLYIGGEADFIADLGDSVPTSTEIVTLDRQLEIED